MRGSLGTTTVAVPPPAPSGVNVGADSAGSGVRLLSAAVAMNDGDPWFVVATTSLIVYCPATGAASKAVKPVIYPAKLLNSVPSLKNGTAGGPTIYGCGGTFGTPAGSVPVNGIVWT